MVFFEYMQIATQLEFRAMLKRGFIFGFASLWNAKKGSSHRKSFESSVKKDWELVGNDMKKAMSIYGESRA